jgi:hypothetical protein
LNEEVKRISRRSLRTTAEHAEKILGGDFYEGESHSDAAREP